MYKFTGLGACLAFRLSSGLLVRNNYFHLKIANLAV